jgi:hypothetical protein
MENNIKKDYETQQLIDRISKKKELEKIPLPKLKRIVKDIEDFLD